LDSQASRVRPAAPEPQRSNTDVRQREDDRRKQVGDRHAAAQRNLFGRPLGCLHHCLITGQHYDEATAFPAETRNPAGPA